MSYSIPDLHGIWLVILAFLPQYFVFYLSTTSKLVTDEVAAITLVGSQSLLLLFGWLNRYQFAFIILSIGLLANFIVIVSNGGLMPMSPTTLEQLVSADRIGTWHIGERIGQTKDRLIAEDETYFAILSDRMVIPKWTGYAIAYSWGDVLIAVGTFWFLWRAGKADYSSIQNEA